MIISWIDLALVGFSGSVSVDFCFGVWVIRSALCLGCFDFELGFGICLL